MIDSLEYNCHSYTTILLLVETLRLQEDELYLALTIRCELVLTFGEESTSVNHENSKLLPQNRMKLNKLCAKKILARYYSSSSFFILRSFGHVEMSNVV